MAVMVGLWKKIFNKIQVNYMPIPNEAGMRQHKLHLYNSPMHIAIFKLFPSVVNSVGWSTAQSFST